MIIIVVTVMVDGCSGFCRWYWHCFDGHRESFRRCGYGTVVTVVCCHGDWWSLGQWLRLMMQCRTTTTATTRRR